MPKYRFEQIAINSTEKRKPTEADMATYIGLEHMDTQSLTIKRWGSDVPIIGDKLVMKKGDVLLGKRNAYLRRAAIAPFDGLFSAHGMVLRPKENVIDKDFFPIFIASDYFFDEAIRISVGSLSPTINWKDLKDLEFELPSLDEQRKLSKILWSMIKTMDSYEDMLTKQDLLVKSQFIEMFGTHYDNPFGYAIKQISDLFDVGSSKRVFESEWTKSGVPFYRAREILKLSEDGFVDNELFITEEMYERYKSKYGVPKPDDMMVTGVGTLGICYIVKPGDKFYFKDGNTLWFKNKGICNVRFIKEQYDMSYVIDQVIGSANGSTVGTYTITRANETKVMVPPIDLQNIFVEFVEQIDKSKFEIQKSLKNLKKIYERILKENF